MCAMVVRNFFELKNLCVLASFLLHLRLHALCRSCKFPSHDLAGEQRHGNARLPKWQQVRGIWDMGLQLELKALS